MHNTCPDRVIQYIEGAITYILIPSQHMLIVAALPKRSIKFLFIGISTDLFKNLHIIAEIRIFLTTEQQVQVIRHETKYQRNEIMFHTRIFYDREHHINNAPLQKDRLPEMSRARNEIYIGPLIVEMREPGRVFAFYQVGHSIT